MKQNEKTDAQLKAEVTKVLTKTYFLSPEEMGFNCLRLADFGFIPRQKFAIFAKDEAVAEAYVKVQSFMHLVWQSAIIVMPTAALGLVFAFWQLVAGNLVLTIVLCVILFVAFVIYLTGYFKYKPLEKKYLDDEGHLQVLTFYLDRKGQWQAGVCDPRYVARHIAVDED